MQCFVAIKVSNENKSVGNSRTKEEGYIESISVIHFVHGNVLNKSLNTYAHFLRSCSKFDLTKKNQSAFMFCCVFFFLSFIVVMIQFH